MIHYNKYKLSSIEFTTAVSFAAICLFLVGMIFYKHVIIAMIFASLSIFYPHYRSKQLRQRRLDELNGQFKQALYIVSSSLAAGKSVENAFQAAEQDLQLLYPDEQAYIRCEFRLVNLRIQNGEPIERILEELSERTGLEDIQSFTNVFVVCKRSGGNLLEVMRNTANIIGEKISMQQEIAVLLAQKRFEAKVLIVSPICFVALLSYTSADYMAPLYQGRGVFIMTFALIILIFCFFITRKIMGIRV